MARLILGLTGLSVTPAVRPPQQRATAMPMTPEQRSLRARLAAQSRWAKLDEQERRRATQAARDGLAARFADEPNPEAARKAYMTRLALKSSRKRKPG